MKYGKSFQQYIDFIECVKNKKRVIVIGKEYVVLSKELYKKLTSNKGVNFDALVHNKRR